MKATKIIYNSRPTLKLSEEEIKECWKLYGENYGFYRKDSGFNPGKAIKFPMEKYRQYQQEGFYVATARCDGELIAHAFYIRKNYDRYGIITWVLQLVVNREFRQKGIASTLLHSIWGFSNSFAWGLATANPCTVKSLESATCRICDSKEISRNIDAVKAVGKDTTFILENDYSIDDNQSKVNTRFFVDNSSFKGIGDVVEKLGELEPGYEWVAMTFQNQIIDQELFKKNIKSWFEMYDSKLKQAYSRMDMSNHGWTRKTLDEVDFICKRLKGKSILDMGCGMGRHSIELAKRGYDVTGIDFSESNIERAKKNAYKEGIINASFLFDDVRGTRFGNKYDCVLCLYDVIGSFADEKDNYKILESAYENLDRGGVFILSVMNMELTMDLCHPDRYVSLEENPNILIDLKASDIMQASGEVFNPDYYFIDKVTGLVYRKEQFDNNDELSAEYIIRDKRYTMDEITEFIKKAGFEVVESIYTCAGFSDTLDSTNVHAKEILIVARK